MSKPLKVMFIGSFPKVSKGGISTANKLLAASDAFSKLRVYKVDSTLRDIKNNLWIERVLRAILRFFKVTFILIFRRPNVGLIFCGHGAGFVEKGFYLLYSRLFGVRCVLAPRSGIILSNLRNKSFSFFARRVFLRSSYIICQGKYWKRIFGNYTDSDKLVVIHNWLKLPEKRIDCEAEVQGPFKMLYIGWLEQYKGLGIILRAVRELKKEHDNFVLNIYGEGTLRKDIAHFIQDNDLQDHVKLNYWISGEEKEQAYLDSSVLLVASKFEGMPFFWRQ